MNVTEKANCKLEKEIEELKLQINSLKNNYLKEISQLQEELIESENRLFRAEKISNAGSWKINLETKEITASKGANQIYGIHESILPLTEVQKFPLLEYREILNKALFNLVSQNEPYNVEFKIKNAETDDIIDIQSNAEYDAKNKIIYGVIRNITETKKTQQQQHLSNLVFEAAISATSTSDIDGIINSVNPSFLKTWGYTSKDEVIGRSLATFFYKYEDAIPVIASLNNYGIWEGDFKAIKKDGTHFIAHGLATVLKDENDKIIGYQSSVLDISEKYILEQKRHESEQKLNALFSSMTEMVVIHEIVFNENCQPINYRIIDCNNAFTKITGIKKEDAIGKLATDVYQQEQAPYLTEFCKVGITGEAYEYTTYYAPMDKHFVISVVSPSINTFATITTDITAIQQVQKTMSDKNKELENYLYIASHDLRTPLVNIQGFSQRLQKQADKIKTILTNCQLETETTNEIQKITDELIPKTLEYIFSNVIKMDSLINGLLQISRTGRIKMTIRKIDTNKLFQTIIAALNYQLSEIKAQINVKDLPDCYGDENQLNQLFTNILGNAIKYRNQTRPLIVEISGFTNFNKVIYQIKDNGIGIAPKHLEKIWDVFYRINNSTETGEGIGLSLAKTITDKHKGKISAESVVDEGSIFYIELQKNTFNE